MKTIKIIRSIVFNILYFLHFIVAFITIFFVTLFNSFSKLGIDRKVYTILYSTLCFSMRNIAKINFSHNYNSSKYLNGKYIFASKHQSMIETGLLTEILMKDGKICRWIVRKNILEYAIVGKFLSKFESIGVNRDNPKESLRTIINAAKNSAPDARFAIFPEGTRKKIDEEPNYFDGIYIFYKNGFKVIPIALNCGQCFPVKTFIRNPGEMRIDFLDEIPENLSKDEFMIELEKRIEERCSDLYRLN